MTGSDEPRDTPSRELATVHHLPARRDGDVIDGELVTAAAYADIQRRRALERWRAYRRDVVTVTRVTRTVVTHDHAKTAARAVTRHALHVVTGAGVIAQRVWEARTNSRYERVMRAAETLGDWDRLEKWEALGEQARERRHKRTMAWLQAPIDLLRAVVIAGLAATVVLLALGALLYAGTGDPADVLAPIRAVITLVTWVAWAVTIAWGPFILALPWLLVLALWHIGRKADRTPQWCAPAKTRRDSERITPSKVVTAFRDLGIPTLRKAITDMGDAGAGMLSPIRIAGCGVEVDVTLPPGVTTLEVMSRRRKLAENLDRHEHEVFPTVAPSPRTVRVWAADAGALDEPIGPSPLVLDADYRADYQRGAAPWGQNLRGDALPVSVYQRHLLMIGLSNQGKTKGMRALALWLALDPRPELRIADLKGAGDWAMFDGVATGLIEGPSDDHVIAATEMLEDGVREMDRRLSDGGPWEPLILIVDECQQAYMCPAKDEAGRPYGGGKSTSRYLTAVRKIQNQGRAVDVLLWQGAQNPTNQNLPVLAREGAHLRICTAVGTEEQSRMALGDKAVDGGAAPHLLRAGLDKGTVVVAGDGAPLADGESSVTARTHYIDDAAAEEIAARAKALRGPVRRRVVVEEERDLLADVLEALGGDDMANAADMPARLRVLAPGYRGYRHMHGEGLAALLRAEGIKVTDLKGYLKVRADRVRAVLDEREGG